METLTASLRLITTPFKDIWIAARVRLALLGSERRVGAPLAVDVIGGRVTLHGDVDSEAVRIAAEQSIGNISGVTGVHNLLHVIGKPTRAWTDDEIASNVRARLAGDLELGDARIEVSSVYDGVVVLAGTAPTTQAAAHAYEKSIDVEGVRRVIDDVRIAPPPRGRQSKSRRSRREHQRRSAMGKTATASALALIGCLAAAPAALADDDVVIEHSETKKQDAPVIRERERTVEMPASGVESRSKTTVRQGDIDDDDKKVESKTKIEVDD